MDINLGKLSQTYTGSHSNFVVYHLLIPAERIFFEGALPYYNSKAQCKSLSSLYSEPKQLSQQENISEGASSCYNFRSKQYQHYQTFSC